MSTQDLDLKTFDLTAAMAALKQANTVAVTEKQEQIRGERGFRGEKGDPGVCVCREPKDGRDGKDGRPGRDAEFNLVVGRVTTGDSAQASLRRSESGTYLLDLQLPKAERGPEGPASHIPGAPGRDGKDAEPLSLEDLERVAKRIMLDPANLDKFRGRTGDSVVGPRGEPGTSVTEEMLQGVIVKVLSDIIGKEIVLAKMVQVRAELKRCIHEADSRHITHFQTVFRKLDNIIG